MSSLYGHIRALLIDETIDDHLQDIEINPEDEVTPVITRGHADWIEPIGPIQVTITAKVQYPRVGAAVDYWDLMAKRETFTIAFVDCDGKRGRIVRSRVRQCPRSDPPRGERSQTVVMVGFLQTE